MSHKILKIYFFIIFLFLTFGLTFSQIHWVETSQSDFADGDIDPNLYSSWRSNIESDSGCVEWFPRFDLDGNGYFEIAGFNFLSDRVIEKAVIWRQGENNVFSPLFERTEFDFTPCTEDTIASIDSLWFDEETNCNDSNIVEICYILSGDTANVSVQMSSDDGASWVDFGEDWFHTFEDSAGDVGEDIVPGIHCFRWLMSEDFPDIEGMDWAINIFASLDEEECADSLVWEIVDTIISPMGSNQDLAVTPWSVIGVSDGAPANNINLYEYDKCTGELIRTANIPVSYSVPGQGMTYAFGYLWVCEHYNHIFQIDYETMTLINTYTLDLSGFSISPYFEGLAHDDSLIYVVSDGMGYGGYILGFYPDSFVSPSVLARVVTIDIPDGSMDNYEGMTMRDSIFYVTYAPSNQIWLFNFDGDLVDTYYTPYSYPVGAAWDGCFFYLSHHTYDELFIYGDGEWVRPWLCPATDTAYSPLDSRPPDVSLFCPDGAVSAGDTISLHWTIDDLFWSNDECTLYVSYCGFIDTILTTDTLYDFIVPDISCDSICFRVAVRDSFCNWGYDECCVLCSTGLFVNLITPHRDSIIACDDQPIIFKIYYDSLCLPLDADSTMLIIDSVDTYTLDSTQLYFDSADSLLHFEPGSGYWNSGWHFFQLHLRGDCGNTFDSIYSAIFDIDPPTAYMLDPPVGEPMDTSILYTYEPVYIYDLEHPISIRLDDNIAGVLPESTVFIVRGQTIPFQISTYWAIH